MIIIDFCCKHIEKRTSFNCDFKMWRLSEGGKEQVQF